MNELFMSGFITYGKTEAKLRAVRPESVSLGGKERSFIDVRGVRNLAHSAITCKYHSNSLQSSKGYINISNMHTKKISPYPRNE